MSQRITKADLERAVDSLNQLVLGFVPRGYVNDRYWLDCAYGEYKLEYILENGGHSNISRRMKAKELYNFIDAYISGIREGMRLCVKR